MYLAAWLVITTEVLNWGQLVDGSQQYLLSGFAFAKDFVWHNGQVLVDMTYYSGWRWDLEYQFRDCRGSPSVVMSSTADTVYGAGPDLKYYDYAPYGRQIRKELLYRRMTLQFTGHERDGFFSDPDYFENDGVRDYMRARYYSPVDGRFLRPDPAFDFDRLNPASFNLYQVAQ